MAETTLKAVSNADEWIQQQPVTTKEPYSLSPHTDVKELNEKLKDAEQLLFYAAEAGINIEANVRDVIFKAKIANADNKWSEQTAADFLSALTTLASKLKPVTADTLKECADGPTFRASIRWYRKWTIVLALCIVPFSLVTFITSSISEAIRKDIEIGNALAIKLGDEVRSATAQNTSGKEQGSTQIQPRDLQEIAAITRAIYSRAWKLNLFVGSIITDPFGFRRKEIFSSNNKDDTLRQKNRAIFQVTPGIPNFSDEALKRIQVYQDVRSFAQMIQEIVATIYGAMGTCVLPIVYALLGACACLLRSLEEQIKRRTFTKSDAHTARFLIAAIAGGVVGMFNNFNISQNVVTPLAIAFLVGYATDVFFSFLDGLLETFTRQADSQTQSAAKG